jgi:hypothetical protein
MGQIIPLRRGARRRAPSAPPGGGAEILFFLGVRYCRDDTPGQDKAPETQDNGPENKDNEPGKPSNSRSRRKKRA